MLWGRRGGGGRGGRGRGRGGTPFRGRERNPRLLSKLSNTTLTVSVSCLPPAPGQPAFASLLPSPALPLPPPSPAVVVYTDDVAASAIGSEPDPFSGRTSYANDAVAKLTRSALMISILAKNESSKNNSAYSVDAVNGMRVQIVSLRRQIIDTVQMERPGSYGRQHFCLERNVMGVLL